MATQHIVEGMVEHTWADTPPKVNVKVTKGQRGGYGWEITVLGHADPEEARRVISSIDSMLRSDYGDPDGDN